MVEMQVFGLALDEDSQVPVLILKDKEEKSVLPIWIGAMEAMAISLALNKVAFPRPMTHDLLLNALTVLEGKVLRIEITSLEEGTYFAEIVVQQGEVERRIDSRPSDAIALALRAEAPILVNETVLESAGASASNYEEPVLKTEDAEKWNEMLEKFDIDDIKYKM
ncbi:MAG: uncharacterized protein PWQ57_3264 [Desulfovibrionales bacterium]|jgi:bifunctional DNase/RNase|nr:uncharacterized protein [Desulfovibrionales bacterium]